MVQAGNRLFRAVTRGGVTYTGKLLNQDRYTIQMLDSTDRLISLDKTDLRECGFAATPPMPSYKDKFTQAELGYLIGYLTSLQGVVKQ